MIKKLLHERVVQGSYLTNQFKIRASQKRLGFSSAILDAIEEFAGPAEIREPTIYLDKLFQTSVGRYSTIRLPQGLADTLDLKDGDRVLLKLDKREFDFDAAVDGEQKAVIAARKDTDPDWLFTADL